MRPRRGMGLSLPQIRGSGRQPHQLSLSHIFLSTVSLPTDPTHTTTAGSPPVSLSHNTNTRTLRTPSPTTPHHHTPPHTHIYTLPCEHTYANIHTHTHTHPHTHT